jgi:hypothetical protein
VSDEQRALDMLRRMAGFFASNFVVVGGAWVDGLTSVGGAIDLASDDFDLLRRLGADLVRVAEMDDYN